MEKKPARTKRTDPNLGLQRVQQVLFKLYILILEMENDAMLDPTKKKGWEQNSG